MKAKSKKDVSVILTGAMCLTSVAGICQSVEAATEVSASTNSVAAVHAKVEHITYSLRNNYLGRKNVGQWQQYIKEAKALNAKLPKGSSQDKYAERINKAEALINAAARVNHVEKSMAVNAKVMKNLPQWEEYINLAKDDLAKVDLSVFKPQYNSLLERTSERVEAINGVKDRFEKDLKIVDDLYKEAEELSKKDKEKALAKLKEAEEAAKKLDTHSSKDERLKKIQSLSTDISNGTVKPEETKPEENKPSTGGGNSPSQGSNLKNITIKSANELSKLSGEYGTITIPNSFKEDAQLNGVTAESVVISGGSKITLNGSKINTLTVNKDGAVVNVTGGADITDVKLNSSATLNDVVKGEPEQVLSVRSGIARSVASGNIEKTQAGVLVNKVKTVSVNTSGKTIVNVKVEKLLVLKSSKEAVEIKKEVGNLEVNAQDANVNVGAEVVYAKIFSKANIVISKNIVINKLESLTTSPFKVEGEGKVSILELTKTYKEVSIDTDVDDINAKTSTIINIADGKKVITITSTSKEIYIKGKGIVKSISYSKDNKPNVEEGITDGEKNSPKFNEAKAITVVENNSKTSLSTSVAYKDKEIKVKVEAKDGYKVTGISVSGVEDKDIISSGNEYRFKMPDSEVTININVINISGIDKAVTSAKNAKNNVKVSDESGYDIKSNQYWVTEDDEEKLEDAIDLAKDSKKIVKSDDEVKKVIEDLNKAVEAFNNSKKKGLKDSELDKAAVITGVEDKQEINLFITKEGVTPLSESNNIKSVVLTKDNKDLEGYNLGTPVKEVGKYTLKVTTLSDKETKIKFEVINKELNNEEILKIAEKAANKAINNLVVTNKTYENNILELVKSVVTEKVSVSYGEKLFVKTDANVNKTGSIVGELVLSIGEGKDLKKKTVAVNKTIAKLANKTSLESAMNKARENLTSVKTSKDGSDVLKTEKWVTDSEYADYKATIEIEALSIFEDVAASQKQVDNIIEKIKDATKIYDKSKKDGLKEEAEISDDQKAVNSALQKIKDTERVEVLDGNEAADEEKEMGVNALVWTTIEGHKNGFGIDVKKVNENKYSVTISKGDAKGSKEITILSFVQTISAEQADTVRAIRKVQNINEIEVKNGSEASDEEKIAVIKAIIEKTVDSTTNELIVDVTKGAEKGYKVTITKGSKAKSIKEINVKEFVDIQDNKEVARLTFGNDTEIYTEAYTDTLSV